MSVGGARLAETLVSRRRQRPVALSTAPVGVWKGVWVRLGLVVNTLLGPEGTSTVPGGGLVCFFWVVLPDPVA